MLAPRAIVFDLDGTLVESRYDLAEAVNRLRQDLALPPLDPGRVTDMVGEGARRLVERALGDAVPADTLDVALDRFLRHYDAVCLRTTRTYPGIDDLLRRLAARVPLAVLTNKPSALTRKILAGLGLDGRFRTVVAGDTIASRKPDPEGLLLVARRLEVSTAGILLVGDSPTDARTAAAAGARLALVEWGFAPREALDGFAAEIRARSVEELTRHLLAPDPTVPGSRP